jgi:SNF2 family DNA or RNA helicase
MTLQTLWKGFTYFPHQEEGIHWMLSKEQEGTVLEDTTIYGGFQCDDMGLGKTIQVTSVLVHHVQPNTLLLAPLAMLDTWTDALQHAGCVVYQMFQKEWKEIPNAYPFQTKWIGKKLPSVYVTNYEKLYTAQSVLKSMSWDRMVLDEAHKIRNPNSQLFENVQSLTAKYRWVVTGTPLVNSMRDMVALLAFLQVPMDSYRWKKEYEVILPSLLLHRSLDSLRDKIPNAPAQPVIHSLSLPFMTKEEEKFYHQVCEDGKEHPLTKLLRMRQLSVHPQIYIHSKRRSDSSYKREDWGTSSTKVDAIEELIRKDQKNQAVHQYLIFCQFHEEMSLIRQSLLKHSLVLDSNIVLYHGGMTQKERSKVLSSLPKEGDTEPFVMLLQLQAGGVGLNLQQFDRVIFVSPWWTSAMMDQAIGRAVRIGQKRVVHVYHLSLEVETERNIDIMINEKANIKRNMLEDIFGMCR